MADEKKTAPKTAKAAMVEAVDVAKVITDEFSDVAGTTAMQMSFMVINKVEELNAAANAPEPAQKQECNCAGCQIKRMMGMGGGAVHAMAMEMPSPGIIGPESVPSLAEQLRKYLSPEAVTALAAAMSNP